MIELDYEYGNSDFQNDWYDYPNSGDESSDWSDFLSSYGICRISYGSKFMMNAKIYFKTEDHKLQFKMRYL